MLQTNQLKRALAVGKTAFGLLNSIPSPLLVEMIGYAGYDFVILDMEHVCVNPETLENMVRAAECAGITPLVRVPNAAPEAILRAPLSHALCARPQPSVPRAAGRCLAVPVSAPGSFERHGEHRGS
ncbi:MAG: hypothetical protein M1449_14175, partial [Candidatus Thermoplasmatota archaeon]|nr:hypothetical protein [Candidatus Thermoplasmatota archaeon]